MKIIEGSSNVSKQRSKTITVLLDNGTVTGIRHAELINWTGQAISCPRRKIKKLSEWKEVKRPGVYFLVSASPFANKPLVYIGESEDVCQRLEQQLAKKDFWREVIVFTNKDDNLTRAHIRYLEARLCRMIKDIDRAELENSSLPCLPKLPRSASDAMEDFIDNLRIIVGVLGYRFLVQLAPRGEDLDNETAEKNEDVIEFFFKAKQANARGMPTDEGFVVFKGSTVAPTTVPSIPKSYRALRDSLQVSGILQNNGDDIVFAQDYLFSSSSAAACLISGNSRNGRDCWKTSDGKTLGQVEDGYESS